MNPRSAVVMTALVAAGCLEPTQDPKEPRAGVANVAASEAPDAGATEVLDAGAASCGFAWLAPGLVAAQPAAPVATLCARPATSSNPVTTAWLVGRWVRCSGANALHGGQPAIEFGENGRWRALAYDATGALVPDASDDLGTYGVTGSGQLDVWWERALSGETYHPVALDADVLRLGGPGRPVYARATPVANNGADNLPPVTDGQCSMAGTWDGASPSSGTNPASSVSIAFTSLGDFVAASGVDVCDAHSMEGTYSLVTTSSGPVFTIVTSAGMGCPSGMLYFAGYTTAFSADCRTLRLTRRWDNCTGGRRVLMDTTELTRR